jgi:hypothetical protein
LNERLDKDRMTFPFASRGAALVMKHFKCIHAQTRTRSNDARECLFWRPGAACPRPRPTPRFRSPEGPDLEKSWRGFSQAMILVPRAVRRSLARVMMQVDEGFHLHDDPAWERRGGSFSAFCCHRRGFRRIGLMVVMLGLKVVESPRRRLVARQSLSSDPLL